MKTGLILSLIIPCYGKTDSIVRESLKTANLQLEKHSDKVEVIFVYKNLNDFNYDWVSQEFSNFKVFKVEDTTVKRTYKIKEGLKHASGKYFYTLDPDDFINDIYFENILKKLSLMDAEVVVMDYILRNLDSSKKPKYVKMSRNNKVILREFYGFPGNYNVMYKTEHFKAHVVDFVIDKYLWFNDNYMIFVGLQNARLGLLDEALITWNRGKGDSNLRSHYNPDFITHFENLNKQFTLFQFKSDKNIKKLINKQYQTMLNTYYISLLMNYGHLKAVKQANSLTDDVY